MRTRTLSHAGFSLLLFALSLSFAVTAHATLPGGCGNEAVQFKVKTDKSQAVPLTAEPNKARIVFVQTLDGEPFASGPLSRFGVDGSWVGATKGSSYFAISVDPGMHTICASRQSGIAAERENVGTAKINARAGQTYYLNFKVSRNEVGPAQGHAAGQSLGYASPDMTSKPRDTIDTAEFSALDSAKAEPLLKHMQVSVSAQK